MERRLLAELQSSSSSDDQLKELYGRVSDLRAHVILNYLAVLKITKKHDKQSPNNPIREQALSRPPVAVARMHGPSAHSLHVHAPSSDSRLAISSARPASGSAQRHLHTRAGAAPAVRRQAVEHMSGLAFYLSLEHSYPIAPVASYRRPPG